MQILIPYVRDSIYRVHMPGMDGREVDGHDQTIIAVPDEVLVRGRDGRLSIVDVRVLNQVVRDVSVQGAENLGVELHHAEWILTDDAAVVEKRGMAGHQQCAAHRAAVDQVLAHLAEHGQPLLVGTLFWAAPA